MKTKIFFDFDGTIFDTKKLKVDLFEVFRRAGFSDEDINNTYKAAGLDYNYSPAKQLSLLGKVRSFDETATQKRLQKLYENAPACVFTDVPRFFKNVDRKKYELILFTLGDKEFQAAKVEHSKIVPYFDSVHYTSQQKWEAIGELIKPGEKFIFVDDRGDAVFEMSKRFKGAFALEINRFATPSDPMEPLKDFHNITIKDFDQLAQYLSVETPQPAIN